jgi:hypothetical protein
MRIPSSREEAPWAGGIYRSPEMIKSESGKRSRGSNFLLIEFPKFQRCSTLPNLAGLEPLDRFESEQKYGKQE